MSKHTPGPWHHYTFGPDRPVGPYIVAITVDPNGDCGPIRGYTVTCGYNPNASTYWPARGIGGRSDDEAIANAQLISAAPDLYDVSRRLADFDDETGSPAWTQLLAAARAAIAKAEGREPKP
jgi:hypothetical protein